MIESSLRGKVVIVTGAARGQGASHVRALATAGAVVLAADIRDGEGRALAAELRAEGYEVEYRHHDVVDPASWAELREATVTGYGHIDGLVNNAGVMRVVPIEEEEKGQFERVLSINTTSVLLGLNAILPVMRAQGSGAVVNVSSTAALSGAAGYGAYAASKAAILGLTRVAAIEMADAGVRVNAIAPGGVSTHMNDEEPVGGMGPGTPMGHRAEPEEISPLVMYLLSDASSFVTGSTLAIDGGFLAQ